MNCLLGILILLAPSCSAADAPQVVFAQVGNSVTLPRKIWGSEEKVHVNWMHNGETLISRNPVSSSSKTVPTKWQGRLSLSKDYSLIISPVHESDFEIFKCEQHELVDTITIAYRLYRVTMSTPSPLLAGASLSLSCEIDSEGFKRADPSIKWIGPDNSPYTGSSNGNKHTLSVKNVSRLHSGKWICNLKYGGNTLNATSNVVIVDLAPSPPDPLYTSDTSPSFPLPCFLSSKLPWSTVNATGVTGGSWSFNPLSTSQSTILLELQPNPTPVWKVPTGSESSFMETQLKNHELSVQIPKVSIKNRGNYTCSLEFGSKTLKTTVKVEVLQVISSAGKVIYEGKTVNLTCSLGHSKTPDLEVNWIHPNHSSLTNLSPLHAGELSIPGIRMKDSGRWKCQLIKNTTVLTVATVYLKIEKAPVDSWLVAAIVGGVLVFILLAVITVIIIRRRKQVMRYSRRKKRYCRCRNPQPKGFYKT